VNRRWTSLPPAVVASIRTSRPKAQTNQAPRVAKARNVPVANVRALIAAHIHGRTFGILGEPRVDVLDLNRALDAKSKP